MKLPQFRKRWLLIFVALAAALSFFAVRWIRDAREAAFAMSCANNFKQTVLALHNYHDTYDSLPPARIIDANGKPMHSWRASIQPFMASHVYRYKMDEPWDGPNNRLFALNLPFEIKGEVKTQEEAQHYKGYVPPGVYEAIDYGTFHRCPCQDHGEAFITDMVAVTGEHTAWPDSKTVSLSDITDSHDTTILVVEINHSDILWSEPQDLRFDLMHFEINSPRGPSISSPHPQGPAVAFVDGSVARLSNDLPPEVVKAMLTIAGGEKLDKEEMRRKGWLR